MRRRLPLGAAEAESIGFVDAVFADDPSEFMKEVEARAAALSKDCSELLAAKQQKRAADEAIKPLAVYRAEELQQMQRNFYGFDPSYHVARHNFVAKVLHSWTPRHLALHRELGWKVPA